MKQTMAASSRANDVGLLNGGSWWIRPALTGVGLVIASFYLDPYLAHIASSWVIYGLLGLSLDLVWGRGGILSLGQTALFGLGGYAGGIVAINCAHLTGNTLVWLIPLGALVGGIVAMGLGWFMFFSRMGPLQITIITYTFTLVLWTGAESFSAKIGRAMVGGDNGMSDIPSMIAAFGAEVESPEPNETFLIVW